MEDDIQKDFELSLRFAAFSDRILVLIIKPTCIAIRPGASIIKSITTLQKSYRTEFIRNLLSMQFLKA